MKWLSRWPHNGRPSPFADGQVAAIAATHDLTLITFNYEGYVGLHLSDNSPRAPLPGADCTVNDPPAMAISAVCSSKP